MAPSKRWMDLVDDRLSEAYDKGVQNFLDYAFKRTGQNNKIRCPCVKCSNTYSGTRELVETHLKVYGIVQSYTFWYHHGERSGESQSESNSDDDEEIEEDESEDTIKQYDKIVDATQSKPSLSNTELVEECFGLQRHNHIICHGGGLKPNDMKNIKTRAELQAKLRETQRENDSLKSRMDEMEADIRMIKEMFQRQHSNGPPPSSSEG